MKFTRSSVAAATAAAAVILSAVAAPSAFASGKGGGGGGGGRPGGQGVSTSGTGSLGSHWTLKSKHDDDGPGPVAGEEFEINSPTGHVWTVTLADNGQAFFGPQDVAATADGVRAMGKAGDTGTVMVMSVHAVDKGTGEVIDGSVDLPAL